MNIAPVNCSDINFNGRVIASGKNWTPRMKQMFEESPYLKDFKSGYDVIGRVLKKKSDGNDMYHSKGQILYKIMVSLVKEDSKLYQLLDKLHLLSRKSLSVTYHSETSTLERFNKRYIERLKRRF